MFHMEQPGYLPAGRAYQNSRCPDHHFRKSLAEAVDADADIRFTRVATPMANSTHQSEEPRIAAEPSVLQPVQAGSAGLPGLSDVRAGNGEIGLTPGGSNFETSGEAAGDNPTAERSATSRPEQVGLHTPGERPGLPITGRSADGHRREDALADLLEAAARLIRGGGR